MGSARGFPQLQLWVACAGVILSLSALQAEVPDSLARPLFERAFPLNESKLARYRINIHQVTPDTGITTRYVIAYGYYIQPPYEVVARAGSTYVNAVRIYPLLEQPEKPVDTTAVVEQPTGSVERWKRIGKHLDFVPFRVKELLFAGLDDGLDTTRAFARAESMIVAMDSLVDSTKFVGNGIIVFGPEVEKNGRRYVEWRYGGLPPVASALMDADSLRACKQHVAEHMAENWRNGLKRGLCWAVTWGYEGSDDSRFVRKLLEFLSDGMASTRTHWYDLVRFAGPPTAYSIAANFENSKAAWNALSARLEER